MKIDKMGTKIQSAPKELPNFEALQLS